MIYKVIHKIIFKLHKYKKKHLIKIKKISL